MDVDRQGNVWIADARAANEAELKQFPDAAGKGHTVTKFSPQGKVLLMLGTPGKAGNPPAASPSPTTCWSPPTAAFSSPRRTTRSSSTRTGPSGVGRSRSSRPTASSSRAAASYGYGPGEFRGPHALAFDSKGRLFVADRGNRRIQIFDQEGKHLDTWYQFSRISGLDIDADDTLYAIDSESDDNYNPGWRKGLRVGSARTGEVWYFVPEHVSKQASGMGGYGSMGEGVDGGRRRATSTAARSARSRGSRSSSRG